MTLQRLADVGFTPVVGIIQGEKPTASHMRYGKSGNVLLCVGIWTNNLPGIYGRPEVACPTPRSQNVSDSLTPRFIGWNAVNII